MAGRDGNMTSRKQEERNIREAYRREQKIESYLADDENFPSFATQLKKLGLQLRDIPGDGNCLFRALGDQLEGHSRNHFRHRQEVVQYMMEHRKDFEPFVEDDLPFDVHINNLKKLGTHAGNDAIVAFAKLHNVNIMIHQLGGKPLLIQGQATGGANIKQLHIAYHNFDHYSSVRRLNDNTESPANIRIQDSKESLKDSHHASTSYDTNTNGVVKAKRGIEHIEAEVIAATNCQDADQVREALLDCDYDADAAIAYLMQQLEMGNESEDDVLSLTSQHTSTDSGIWACNGTGTHIFGQMSVSDKAQKVHFRDDSYGGSSGYSSLGSNKGGGARPKLTIPTEHNTQLSDRKRKEVKKMEKKKRAEERHRQRILGIDPHQQHMQQNEAIIVHHDGHVKI
ncbi:hypothetical protein C0Q70_03845 [Pomacea canaliculata]|uniref:OTU domain-containing protein n=2 Tax=Pomacea canaliculata TaxID=400727 RepID=A0A2T7PTV6_POMCA|nr:hypothetical protein C0Q70_03845 [Pomacea canaliculata]